jgi:hypothetical protein
VTQNQAPPAQDRFGGMAPLAVQGKDVRRAHYDMVVRGQPIGEERVAVGVIGPGQRVLAGQIVAELGGRIETSYTVVPDGATVAVKSPFGALQLSGKVTSGALVVTGTDATGKPVSLSAPVPAGAFLAAPGIGGPILMADKLAGMKVGDRRALASLEISSYPKVAIGAAGYDVERKPDADGHRVFAVTATIDKTVSNSELVLDADGSVVRLRSSSPMFEIVYTRTPQ